MNLFNRDLNRTCLVYMISFRFSGSKFLINLRWQFRERKILRDLLPFYFAFTFCILLFRKCVTYVVGCYFIKTCSLTGC